MICRVKYLVKKNVEANICLAIRFKIKFNYSYSFWRHLVWRYVVYLCLEIIFQWWNNIAFGDI